jgi:hypothetical protein
MGNRRNAKATVAITRKKEMYKLIYAANSIIEYPML